MNSMLETITGRWVDVIGGKITPARIRWNGGRIVEIQEIPDQQGLPWICPGLVDAHIHIESSMLPPSEFARMALVHGTVATVSDPHEIANVLGIAGIEFMIEDGQRVPFKFFFGASSCVPATTLETSGAALGAREIGQLLDRPEIGYLSEVMNFPAVIHRDPAMMAIIEEARKRNLPIDGHSPGVMGKDLDAYIAAGIQTDHECVTEEEARARLKRGMKVALREGSAARNFDTLLPVLTDYPDDVFFCSDDKHPDELILGHINQLVARAVRAGVPVMTALRAATRNPVQHYRLPVGLLQLGDPADFMVLPDLEEFRPSATFVNGRKVAEAGRILLPQLPVDTPNQFHIVESQPVDFRLPATGQPFPVILAKEGQLITEREDIEPLVQNGEIVADTDWDLLKIVVVNRYRQAPPAVGLVRNFGLKHGAIASSVAHDSHNIVAVGTSDEALQTLVREIIRHRGGIGVVDETGQTTILPLPIAGLMTTLPGNKVAALYEELNRTVKRLGGTQQSPFMTLSFMTLLVIPRLKMSDLGIFDAEQWQILHPSA